MTTFPTIEKLVAVAVKGGHNANDAKGVIEKSYDYLKRVYADTTASKLVNIAYVIY
ncbi:hypothetical protein [Mucilaginibacter sp. 10I4]|uniref:hypothetical protein n=1 Tax=Mucilaginibacter sp. 10I4 TaxID=3048580 RepID=UPI002B226704|nr:hypothetical protein [Mucilaginibacter sp. 10I4]MEB0262887.1 hypothetical protein [Mucilaginibacter sp. 10I4]